MGRLTALVGTGYFCVWMAFGLGSFALGAALAAIEMQDTRRAQSIPLAAGVAVLIAGALQFTRWKARQLACCRAAPMSAGMFRGDAGTAWRHGLRLGVHCCNCCAGLTLVLLVVGLMNLWAMAIVSAAITCERLAPGGARAARAIGIVFVGAGLLMIAACASARIILATQLN